MRKFFLLLILFFSFPISAKSIPDPTRPFVYSYDVKPHSKYIFNLDGILESSGQYKAFVGGKLVFVDDVINGYKILDINKNGIVVINDGVKSNISIRKKVVKQ